MSGRIGAEYLKREMEEQGIVLRNIFPEVPPGLNIH